MDLGGIRRCFVAGQTYLVRAKVRLNSQNLTGKTPCAKQNKFCLRMQSIARFDGNTVGRRKGGEIKRDQWQYNRWEDFMASFTFSSEELASADLMSHVLLINGAEPGVDIEIDDVSLVIAPTYDKPQDICTGNLIINGDAKGADHIYPMEVFGSARLSVLSGFFRVDMRQNNLASIAYFADHCIVPGGRYKVSARLRVRSAPSAVKSIMTFRLGLPDGSMLKREVASCPSSHDDWYVVKRGILFLTSTSSGSFANRNFSLEMILTSMSLRGLPLKQKKVLPILLTLQIGLLSFKKWSNLLFLLKMMES